jgi:predicted enzyme related to lactoylglutathione lyase
MAIRHVGRSQYRRYNKLKTLERIAMPVEKVRYTYLVVDDMNAAVAFYRDGLGLRLKFQDGERWAEFDAGGGTTIALSSRDESGLGVNGPVVVLQASDAEGLAASLVARGAEVLARRDMGSHGRLTAIREPSGNIFQLFEKPASRTQGAGG